MKKVLQIVLGIIIGLTIFVVGCTALLGGSINNEANKIEHSNTVEKEVKKDNASKEFENALKKAYSYAETCNMSKKGVKNQLEFDKFEDDAINYAIDNIKFDWKNNALKSAKNYIDMFNFSQSELSNQLEFDGFTQEEIEYAIENI